MLIGGETIIESPQQKELNKKHNFDFMNDYEISFLEGIILNLNTFLKNILNLF